MWWYRPKNYEDATVILKYLSYVFGLRSFPLKNSNFSLYLSMLYTAFMLTFYTVVMKSVKKMFQNGQMKFQIFVFEFMFFLFWVALITFSVMGLLNRKGIVRYREKVVEIERNLETLGVPVNCSDLFNVCFWYMFAWFIYAVITNAFYASWVSAQTDIYGVAGIFVAYTYGEIVTAIVLLEFIIAIYWQGMAFERTNFILLKDFTKISITEKKKPLDLNLKNIKSLNAKNGNFRRKIRPDLLFRRIEKKEAIFRFPAILVNEREISKSSQQIYRIWIIRKTHLELSRVAKLLFDIYTVQVAFEIGLILIFLTGKLYYIYFLLSSFDYSVSGAIEIGASSVADCCVLSLKMFFLCSVCERVVRQVNKTVEIVHQIPTKSDIEFKAEVHQFALQLTQIHQSLEARGFSKLSYNYIRVCLNSVATSLVIMIQMGNST